jgi:hypothetical protein
MNALCTLALVLLMDVSGSVTSNHYELQQQGLVQAFEDTRLQQIILNQPHGVAVTLHQFGSTSEVTINWRMLRNTHDLQSFVGELRQMNRSEPGDRTGISNAMMTGIQAFEHAPCEAEQKIIDVSADGKNNIGHLPSIWRDRAQELLITVNGLPIVSPDEPELADHFMSQVITPDGFVVVAQGMVDFSRAIRRKLTLEIAGR